MSSEMKYRIVKNPCPDTGWQITTLKEIGYDDGVESFFTNREIELPYVVHILSGLRTYDSRSNDKHNIVKLKHPQKDHFSHLKESIIKEVQRQYEDQKKFFEKIINDLTEQEDYVRLESFLDDRIEPDAGIATFDYVMEEIEEEQMVNEGFGG